MAPRHKCWFPSGSTDPYQNHPWEVQASSALWSVASDTSRGRKKSCSWINWIFIQLCYTAGNEQLSHESKIFLLQNFKHAKKIQCLFLPCTSKPSAQHLAILLPRALPGTSFPLRPVAHHGRFLLATAIPGGSVSSNKGVCESIEPQGRWKKQMLFPF